MLENLLPPAGDTGYYSGVKCVAMTFGSADLKFRMTFITLLARHLASREIYHSYRYIEDGLESLSSI
jgi:hypothetical protein